VRFASCRKPPEENVKITERHGGKYHENDHVYYRFGRALLRKNFKKAYKAPYYEACKQHRGGTFFVAFKREKSKRQRNGATQRDQSDFVNIIKRLIFSELMKCFHGLTSIRYAFKIRVCYLSYAQSDGDRNDRQNKTDRGQVVVSVAHIHVPYGVINLHEHPVGDRLRAVIALRKQKHVARSAEEPGYIQNEHKRDHRPDNRYYYQKRLLQPVHPVKFALFQNRFRQSGKRSAEKYHVSRKTQPYHIAPYYVVCELRIGKKRGNVFQAE